MPADVSHEFGSCAALNGTCREHVRPTLFCQGICVYRAREPVAPAKSSTKDYENIHGPVYAPLFPSSFSRVCSTLSLSSDLPT